jgi:hypothetical protein
MWTVITFHGERYVYRLIFVCLHSPLFQPMLNFIFYVKFLGRFLGLLLAVGVVVLVFRCCLLNFV